MTTIASRKAKGRRLQQYVRDLILKTFPFLTDDDVRSTSMGASGEDVLLSSAARKVFPFSIECKNTESLNIWSAITQCEKNSKNNIPLIVFKRNNTKVYCALELDELIKLLKINQ